MDGGLDVQDARGTDAHQGTSTGQGRKPPEDTGTTGTHVTDTVMTLLGPKY